VTLELIFVDVATDKIVFAVTEIVAIRWITPSEIGFTKLDGRLGRAKFKPGERLVIQRINDKRNPKVSS
jgi:hypothetical protein